MQVDDSDLDITLKTPPNIRKVKSRSNSTATPQHGSSQVSKASMSNNLAKNKLMKKRKLAMKTEASESSALEINAIKAVSDKKNGTTKKR